MKNFVENKFLLYGLGAVALVGVGIYAVNKVGGFFSSATDLLNGQDHDDKKDENEKFLSDLRSQGLTPNYTVAQYQQGANELHAAMKGAGNDFQAIAKVFDGVINEVDARLLYKYFGVRDNDTLDEYLRTELNARVGTISWVNLKTGKMFITDEINAASMARSILRRNGVNYAV